MRVISLVPSWTETLIEAGVEVVGRTQFCIHPQQQVAGIPVVGGTKRAFWKKLESISADYVLMDKEENVKDMAERCSIPVIATHVQDLHTMASELHRMGEVFRSETLKHWAHVTWQVQQQPSWSPHKEQPPALIRWLRPPQKPWKQAVYLIWKDPWMAVSQDTFIGSVLEHCGWRTWMWSDPRQKYPKLDLADFDPEHTLLLCSSEPYPFAKRAEELPEGFPAALVDGEPLSWFGIRSLRFLTQKKEP